ncbi:11750_t:CDS:2 [Dentiscutata erythropus]|uniref:11750_t:CDS:1 n=1 Tax=Dentiscutata erythropus TaxID=1348616 RepID=A0A9N9GEV3_9GLOM|nr:11750_t:CDS:2 [Dentiscutata erythropus]
MCKKHHIEATTYQKIIYNQRPLEPIKEWHKILESVSISDRISENNQESLQLVSTEYNTSFTNIQEDKVIHIEHLGDDKDGESSPIEKNRITNSSKDDTSRWESDLEKLINDTKRLAPILPSLSQ